MTEDAQSSFDSYAAYFNIVVDKAREGNDVESGVFVKNIYLSVGATCFDPKMEPRASSHGATCFDPKMEPRASYPAEPRASLSSASGPEEYSVFGATLGAAPWKLAMLTGALALWDVMWDQEEQVVPASNGDVPIGGRTVERAFGLLEMIDSNECIMAGKLKKGTSWFGQEQKRRDGENDEDRNKKA